MLLQQDVIFLTESFKDNPILDFNLYATVFHIPYCFWKWRKNETLLQICKSPIPWDNSAHSVLKKKVFGIDNKRWFPKRDDITEKLLGSSFFPPKFYALLHWPWPKENCYISIYFIFPQLHVLPKLELYYSRHDSENSQAFKFTVFYFRKCKDTQTLFCSCSRSVLVK
jgi:hypothetical protein